MVLPAFLLPSPLHLRFNSSVSRNKLRRHVIASAQSHTAPSIQKTESSDVDVVVIGSGIGALTAAADLASKGASVGVLERYLIPGGSSGYFVRDGYTFDAGASMIFGFGERGTTNLLTRALACVGRKQETVADPVQVRYHLPGINIRVHQQYERFLEELIQRFPAEENGIRSFYAECWSVFNSLNAMPLRSLEEPNYLLRVFFAHPLPCLNLLRYIARNAGDIARKHISDKDLLRFIDMECYSWSVVPADLTPMINAGMVFSDRHYGGINYPVGGVGKISQELVRGIEDKPGCWVRYGARVTRVFFEGDRACGVQLANGSVITARAVISNATRWDTFGERGLVESQHVPPSEHRFRERYVKSPSFCSAHIAVRETDLRVSMREDDGMDCHHIMLDDWNELETAHDGKGTLFVSIPTVLDKSIAPEGKHIFHVFTPSWMDEWQGLSKQDYEAKKQSILELMIDRLERTLFPGLKEAIEFAEVGSPRTHRRFLGRVDGSYGPVAKKKLKGLLSMPFNRTDVDGLYCVGDSTFPGQGLNATAFSGFACGHRVAADLGLIETLPKPVDSFLTDLLSKTRLQL
ncbi:Prolycopene isomerase, chloroplastic [Gracilariopsis chorda]|uniref:prolycopene isomerase n=2 Tax=Gracilariopsis TaxID=2781 RepID=A0A2V3IRL7_9FLOR|nr:prolycopene isomerase [Gracilariopsis lemaneiformis]PXF44771.1 Prolycopene isomerase, chloroplastic [Gracilariopsis chorda]|eukprot:PXF44771.1 Prolycopene isomerase, chloroplastic [Gracilariopsis chorda]